MVKGGRSSTYRERHRENRRREFLEAARAIVNESGVDSLTMQGVTDVVGSSTGGIYVYFPTREDLVAALQDDAFVVLSASYRTGQQTLERFMVEAGSSTEDIALARAFVTGRFWIEAERTLPNEVELTRRLIGGAGAAQRQASTFGIPASAMELIQLGVQHFDEAVDAQVLDPGNSAERAVSMVAAITGVLMTSNLGTWDRALFDGTRLAQEILEHIFVGWGASRSQLGSIVQTIDDFSTVDDLAPHRSPEPG